MSSRSLIRVVDGIFIGIGCPFGTGLRVAVAVAPTGPALRRDSFRLARNPARCVKDGQKVSTASHVTQPIQRVLGRLEVS